MSDDDDDRGDENPVKKAMRNKRRVKADLTLIDGGKDADKPRRRSRPKAGAGADKPPAPDPDDPGPDDDDLPDFDEIDLSEDIDEAMRAVIRRCAAFDQNDRDNARRLIAWFGHDLAYVTGLGWLKWQGTHWQRDEGELDVRLLAQTIVDKIKLEAFEIEPSAAQRRVLELSADALRKADHTKSDLALIARASGIRDSIAKKRGARVKFAVSSGNASKTSAMLVQAQSLKCRPIEQLDANPMQFNTQNGTLRFWREPDPDAPAASEAMLGRFEFNEHAREDMITKLADVDYDATAACPFFLEQFLAKVQPDPKMQLFLQVSTAYALLIANNDEQRLFYHYGKGANGKSAFIELIGRLAGSYRSVASPETITGDGQRAGQQANPDIARLHNIRFLTIEELPKNVPLREELIKALTGGTKILARFLNKDFFEFMPEFTPMLSGNSKPAISGTDYGIWRRVLLILWGVTIPESEKIDPAVLAAKLDAERSGILNWLIEGVMLYLANGLAHYIPAEVTAFTQDYREERDNVGVFAEVAIEPAEGESVRAGDIYKAYKQWCEVNELRAATQRSFGDRLGELGFKKNRGNYYVYLDIRLKPTPSRFDPVSAPPARHPGDPGWAPPDM